MSKMILNPVTNVQNVIQNKDLTELVEKTTSQLLPQLLQISGPYARNAFIMHSNQSLSGGMSVLNHVRGDGTKLYLKDGRKVLDTIEYASPAQRYIKDELIARVGGRVDAACSDGTTTSMIFALSFLENMIQKKNDLKFFSIGDVERAYDIVTRHISERMRDLLVTAEGIQDRSPYSLKESRYVLAYMQAYTSASGNAQVANAVATVINNTPMTEYCSTIQQRYTIEETEEVAVNATFLDSDVHFESYIVEGRDCNKHRGQVFEHDNCHLLVVNGPVCNGSMLGTAIQGWISTVLSDEDKAKELKESGYLVVIIPGAFEQHDQPYLMEKLEPLRTELGIGVVVSGYIKPRGYEVGGADMYSINAINAKADVDIPRDANLTQFTDTGNVFATIEPFIIKGASVNIDRYRTKISNLIDWSRIPAEEVAVLKEDNLHPGEKYPELYPARENIKSLFVKEIKRLIAMEGDPHEVTIADLKKALATITCDKLWVVDVKGKSRDQQAFQYVLDDATGAVMEALDKGVHFNGPLKLVNCIHDLFAYFAESDVLEELGTDRTVVGTILESLMRAACTTANAMFGPHLPQMRQLKNVCDTTGGTLWFSTLVRDKYSYLDIYAQGMMKESTGNDISWEQTKSSDFEMTVDHILGTGGEDPRKDGHFLPPCQVGTMVDVLFERIRESGLRFTMTSSIIAPMTVWNDGQLDNK